MPEYGEPDADDGGRVSVVLTGTDDPRLVGWVQRSGFSAEPGKAVLVDSVELSESGDLFDRTETLMVFVATERPGEERQTFPFPLFFRRADDKSLDTLETFQDALRRTLNTDDIKGLWDGLKTDDDPFPTGVVEPKEIDSAFLGVVMIEGFIQDVGQTDSELAQKMALHLGTAYHVGRALAIWELKRKFEEAAKAGLDISRQKRAGGKARGDQIKAAADTWHQPTIVWVQGLIDAEPLRPKPISYSALAAMVWDLWDERGFDEGPADPPDILYLAKTLLPRWATNGLINRPTDAQQTPPAG
ncbi:hypothetical protein [Brevundimonas sp.]|uniref:hypothetical protein n=1 Tax=Brevundimonas sp. TaxID=1871086 RepID=UPI003D0FE956